MDQRIRSLLAGRGLGAVLVKAATGSAGLRMVGMGFGFLVGIQLARALGTEGYGIYGLAMSVIALLMVPTEFGLPQLVVRETAANVTRGEWGKIRGLLAWSQRVSLFGWLIVSALVATAVALGSGWIGRELSSALLVGLATASDDGTDPTYGLGLQYRFTDTFALRGEYSRFEMEDVDVDLAQVQVRFDF